MTSGQETKYRTEHAGFLQKGAAGDNKGTPANTRPDRKGPDSKRRKAGFQLTRLMFLFQRFLFSILFDLNRADMGVFKLLHAQQFSLSGPARFSSDSFVRCPDLRQMGHKPIRRAKAEHTKKRTGISALLRRRQQGYPDFSSIVPCPSIYLDYTKFSEP